MERRHPALAAPPSSSSGLILARATAAKHEALQTATEQAPKVPRLRSPGRRFPRDVVPPCTRAVQIAGKLQAPPTATEQDKEEDDRQASLENRMAMGEQITGELQQEDTDGSQCPPKDELKMFVDAHSDTPRATATPQPTAQATLIIDGMDQAKFAQLQSAPPPHKQLQIAEQKLFRAAAAFQQAVLALKPSDAQEERRKRALAFQQAELALKDAQEERKRALAAISACAFAELEASRRTRMPS